jgi:outer membrane receptor for ferrienterochelin and colicins
MQQQGELEAGSDITSLLNNKKLLPETSRGMHFGVRYHQGRWHVESGIFRNDIANLIDVYLLPIRKIGNRPLFSYQNINRIFTQGIETDISYTLTKTITLTAGYQYLEAKDKDVLEKIRAGKLYRRDPVTFRTSQVKESEYFGLNNRSRHQVNAKITWNHEKSRWGVFLRCVYRGAYGFEDNNGNGIADDERELVKGFMMMNLTAAKTFRQVWSIQAGVDNMLNHTNVLQMPNLAGRIYFININYSIHQLFNKNKPTT